MNKRKFFEIISSSLSSYALAILLMVFAIMGTAQIAAAQVIYDNGPFATGSTSKNGTAAPAGKQWSEVQNDNGNTTQSNTLAASGCQAVPGGNNRCADDFTVPVGETWTINQVTVYIIQIGATTNPVTNMNLRIWNGRPADPTSTIVFGDTTTNRFVSSTDTNTLRAFNSAVPASNVPRTDLTIWEVKIAVSPAAVLTAGTYWVDFQTTTTAAQFTPLTTYVGARNVPLDNARQFTSSTGLWADVVDAGNPAAAPDVRLGIPFKLDGSKTGVAAIPRNRWMDFDGDNISDYAVARATGAGSAATWWIKNSSGPVTTGAVGNGIGFAGGDIATPADFDGDGKTDIAAWKPGAALTAGFSILRSTTNTVTFEAFGQTGDDPTIVRDYDGDAKADVAVYRPGASGTFFYRGTLSNPSGNVTYVPWGITGDRALPGDFDGDGKADFSVIRNNGGLAEHWQRFATGATNTFQYGLNTDKFSTGDFDLDNRSDVVAIRTAGSLFNWYLLKSSDSTLVFEEYGDPATDYPITGDYDGDGRTDFAVWRSGTSPEQGFFFSRNSRSARSQSKWGQSSANLTAPDYPVANFIVK